MKKTNLLIAVLCVTGLTAPAAAQGLKKALPTAVRAITQKAPVRLPGTKRFIFPSAYPTLNGVRPLPQINQALQRNISQAEVAVNRPAPVPPLPTFAIFVQGLPEKTFLELISQERAFYQEETILAFNLLSQIKALRSLQEASLSSDEHLLTDIAKGIVGIKNDYLRNLALNLLEENNFKALQEEIAQYYSLGMPFEDAAFNYTLRHPYKRNLQTMRLLHNPFIDQKFKDPVQAFISQPIIPVAQRDAFKQALKELETEYERILDGAANTPAVQAQIDYYEQTIEDLYHFIANPKNKEHRRPKWNTPNKEEQDLHTRVEYLISIEKQYNYEPFAQHQRNLRQIWDEHQPQHWTQEKTLQAFEKFLQQAPKECLYPRSWEEGGSRIPLQEEQLFDNLMFWRTQNEAEVNQAINNIQRRHILQNQ